MALVFKNTAGVNSRTRKLTAEQVLAIRAEFDSGLRGGNRGKAFGISQSAYDDIGRRQTWGSVPEASGNIPLAAQAHNMSFASTIDRIKDRTQTVVMQFCNLSASLPKSRAWAHLQPGNVLNCMNKAVQVKPVARVIITSVGREKLDAICRYPDRLDELKRRGYSGTDIKAYCSHLRKLLHCSMNATLVRIEFKYDE